MDLVGVYLQYTHIIKSGVQEKQRVLNYSELALELHKLNINHGDSNGCIFLTF